MWPIYSREVRGSLGAVRCGPLEALAGTARSWGWAVSEVSCLSLGGYGHNERRLGAVGGGGAVDGGGGAKPSPASGVREEQQLYYLLLDAD